MVRALIYLWRIGTLFNNLKNYFMKQLKLLSLLFTLTLFTQRGFAQAGSQPINAIMITDVYYEQAYTLKDKGVWFKFVITQDEQKQISATTNDANALNKIAKINIYKGSYNNLIALNTGSLSTPQDNEIGTFMDSTSADLGDTIFINLGRETMNPCSGCIPNDLVHYTLRIAAGGCTPSNVSIDSHQFTTNGNTNCNIDDSPTVPVCTLRVCGGEQLCLRFNFLSSGAYPLCGPGNVSFASSLLASSYTVTNSSPNANGFQSVYCFTATANPGFYNVSVSWTYFPSGYVCTSEPPIPPVSHTCYGSFVIEVGPPAPSPQTFTYLPNPACKGGNVCFTASNPNLPGYYYTFNGNLSNPGSLVDINTTGQNICFNYPNAGTFNTGLIVNNGYCPSPQTTQLVTVNNPSVSATITQNSCRNYTFVANPVCLPEGATYTWNIAGLATYTGQTVTANIGGNSSSVTITLTVTAPGLSNPITWSQVISNVPVLDASISHEIDGCRNITLTAQPTACVPSSGVIYNWTSYQTGGGNSIGNPVTFALFPGTTSMAFLLTATDLNGNVLFTTNYSFVGVPTQLENCCSANTDWIELREYVDSLPPGTTIPPFSLVNWNTSQTLSGTQTHINKAFTVGENVVITIPGGANIKFFGCTFQMARGSKIVVNNNAANLTFQSCYLHGCMQLWEGIKMSPISSTTTLTTVNIKNCLIEDAVTALDASSTGVYQKIIVGKTIFNQNIDGIKYINKPGAGIGGTQNRLDVYNSVFTCKTYTYTPGALGAAIFNGVSSYNSYLANAQNAIPLTKPAFQYHAKSMTGLDVQGLAVGTNTCTNRPSYSSLAADVNIMSRNVYDNLVQGINLKGLNLDSAFTRNVFKNITSPINNGDYNNYYQLKATAINYSGESYFNCNGGTSFPYQTNKVGGNALGQGNRNKFTNCYYGIYSKDEPMDVTVNDFTNCYNGVFISNANVPSGNNNAVNCLIRGNTMVNTKYIGYNFYQNNAINVDHYGNSMTYSSAANYNLTSSAVEVHEFNQPAAAAYSFKSNTFTKVFRGITIENANGAIVENNTIRLNSDVPSFNFNAGVHLAFTKGAIVTGNTIWGNGNQNAFQECGIRGHVSPQSTVSCNTIRNTFVGFNFQGPSPSDVFKNDVYNAKFGIWNLQSAAIGNQDNPNLPAGQPSENRWYNTVAVPIIWHSLMQGSTLGSSNHFYTRTSYPHTMILNGYDTPPSTIMTPTPVTNPLLPYIPNCNNTGLLGGKLMRLAPEIAQDILYSVDNIAGRKIAKRVLLTSLIEDNINTQGNVMLDDFKIAEMKSNVGLFCKIDARIKTAMKLNDSLMMDSIKYTNGSISPLDSIEMIQKRVNQIYFNYIENAYEINSSDLFELEAIARLCPYQYGTSIFQARSLISAYSHNNIYLSDCEKVEPPMNNNSRIMDIVSSGNVSITEDNFIAVYPNPNSGSFKITINTDVRTVNVILYSVLGTKVLEKEYNIEDKNDLDFDLDLTEGAYILTISTNSFVIGTEKIIITK